MAAATGIAVSASAVSGRTTYGSVRLMRCCDNGGGR